MNVSYNMPQEEQTKDLYYKIWIHYSVGHYNVKQLEQLFNVSHTIIYTALEWATRQRLQVSAEQTLEASREVCETKLRELREDLKEAKLEKPKNYMAIFGYNKFIKEWEELLMELNGAIEARKMLQQNTVNIQQTSIALQIRDEAVECLTNEQRQALIADIDKVIGESVSQ